VFVCSKFETVVYPLQDLKLKCAFFFFLEDMKFVAQWDTSDRSYVKYAHRTVSMCEKISLYYVHVQ
jgi:hypothetical protein